MLIIHRMENVPIRLFGTCRNCFFRQTNALSNDCNVLNNAITKKPEYPIIRDVSFKGRKMQKSKNWHEEIQKCPTIQEKMIKINMPRYYGYKVVDLNDQFMPYNALPLIQHYTRTILQDMPQTSAEPEEKQLDELVKVVRGDVIEMLEFVHDYFNNRKKNEAAMDIVKNEKQLNQVIVEQLNRIILLRLSTYFEHLRDMEIDYNPRHESFWAVGGVRPPKNIIKSKKGRPWQKDDANDAEDRFIQYTGSPFLALRHHSQLPAWQKIDEVAYAKLAKDLPRYEYDARTLGYSTKYQHAINLPGYWPGSLKNFGFLLFQSCAHLQNSSSCYSNDDIQEALNAQAIQSSYAWLLAQAHYNGFSTYNELTFPMNTQIVLIKGREWSFYEYQMNTVLIHGTNVDTNKLVNLCRGTKPILFYEQITPEGKCVGLNDAVLRQLIRFYSNEPNVKRSIEELQPYVSSPSSCHEKRNFLEKTFKYLNSKRPRHRELPEIYLWEKIYKIDNNTRAMEARRRYFELNINPWRRTLDQHAKNRNELNSNFYP